MDYLLVILQCLFTAIIFIFPGMAILYYFSGKKIPSWPLAFLLAASFTITSLLVTALQYFSLSFLNPVASRIVAWIFITAIVFFMFCKGRKYLSEIFKKVGAWERRSIMFIYTLAGLWIILLPLSPYPSQLSEGLGDPPIYYHTATTLTNGKGWEPDYFIGDYIDGKVAYVKAHPALSLIITLFFQVFGTNWHSLYVYNIFAAGLLMYLIITVITVKHDGNIQDSGILLFLALLVAALPTHFRLFGLGTITVPVALVFLTVVAFCIFDFIKVREKRLIIFSAGLLLFMLRPEGAFLAVLLGIVYFIRVLFTAKYLQMPWRVLIFIIILIIIMIVWLNSPSVINTLTSGWDGVGVFYTKFDSGSASFKYLYEHPSILNYKISEVNFSEFVVISDLKNSLIFREILGHPIAFTRFLLQAFSSAAVEVLKVIFGYRIIFFLQNNFSITVVSKISAAFITIIILFISGMYKQARPIIVTAIIYLFAIKILNFDASARHVLPVSIVILTLTIRFIFHGYRRRLFSWQSLCRRNYMLRRDVFRWPISILFFIMAVVLFIETERLIQVRTGKRNCAYVNIIKDISRISLQEDVVASNYPQLITCMTGRRSVGSTWLTKYFPSIIRKYRPDFIVVDNIRNRSNDISDIQKRDCFASYAPIIYNKDKEYIIFQSVNYQR